MLRFSENPRQTGLRLASRSSSVRLSAVANARTSLSAHGLVEATQSQAEGGTVTGRYMSPLRVAEAIVALGKSLIGLSQTSTDNAIPRFDGTLGNTQNSGVTIDDNNVMAGAKVLASGATTARTEAARAAQSLLPEDFGAVGDGATDDLTPLTNWLNAVMASATKFGVIPAKTYAISAALPNITVSGVTILGGGPASSHDVGSQGAGASVIKKITNSGGTMLTIAPASGGSNQRLDGLKIIGLTFDGNSLAAKCVIIQSVRNSDFDLTCINATTTSLELGVVASLGESRDIQYNRFRYIARNIDGSGASGVPLRLTGDATANVSFNDFQQVDITHKNGLGIIEEDADNNMWNHVRVIQAGGGSATNSIEWRGGSSSAVSCRGETFINLSTTVAAIAKGTGTYTVGAQNIRILALDTENSTPDPTVEAGATAYWEKTSTAISHGWTSWTPTFTSAGGTLGTQTITRARYKQEGQAVHIYIDVSITSAGSSPTGDLRFTLPVVAANVGCAGTVTGREGSANNNLIGGAIDGTNSRGSVSFNAGATPTGNGNVLRFGGTYEAA